MAADTYSLQALVLRKTKLGETDLIVTLLAQDGRQVRAVAKGARKPNSSFASRLEIFSEVDLLLVCGKSLDIVKEAKLLNAHIGVREDMEHAAAAAPIVDLLTRLTQPDLESPRLYDLSASALEHAESCDATGALAACGIYAEGVCVFGFSSELEPMCVCGRPLVSDDSRVQIAFSPAEGGAVCRDCLMFSDTVQVRKRRAFVGPLAHDVDV